MMDKKYEASKKRGTNLGDNGVPDRPNGVGNSQRSKTVVDNLLVDAKAITDWKDTRSTSSLKNSIMNRSDSEFGAKGDRVLFELISHKNTDETDNGMGPWSLVPGYMTLSSAGNRGPSTSFAGVGRSLLCWMLSDKDLKEFCNKKPSTPDGDEEITHRTPLHHAIEEKNWGFLACFLDICCDTKLKHLRAWDAFDATNSNNENCLHRAIAKRIPFAPFIARGCSISALEEKDSKGRTPLHLAMGSAAGNVVIWVPPKPLCAGTQTRWYTSFSPENILNEIVDRNLSQEVLVKLFTTTSEDGTSPFQQSLRKNVPGSEETEFQKLFKKYIYKVVGSISGVSLALYGTKGRAKDLCLDMSDFNQASHNFTTFVEKLEELERTDSVAETVAPGKGGILRFEETLFFVTLPDLNYVKQPCRPETILRLFKWLRNKKVKTIKKLSIPDSTINPLTEAFVKAHITDVFTIEDLDWRKLDMNLDILTLPPPRPADNLNLSTLAMNNLKNITLYSSGNWSVLYHWFSFDGLAKLSQLENVRVNIVQLDQAEGLHDSRTKKVHTSLVDDYEGRLKHLHERNSEALKESWFEAERSFRKISTRRPNLKYVADIRTDQSWDYPLPPHEPGERTTEVIKHEFTSQLLSSLNGLRQWVTAATGQDGKRSAMVQRFRKLATQPDHQMKVAIIDNGVDRIRSKYRDMIADGASFVKADLFDATRPLPWWMVSDPHGTQMASLIAMTNDFCQLYIARVGKGREDISPADAAEAIAWAVAQKVDIISISWTVRDFEPKLQRAIQDASRSTSCRGHRPLIFCSTPDEGVNSLAYPVAWSAEPNEWVISVSATNKWGHRSSKNTGATKPDIQIPGENIQAAGPAYIGNVLPTVSGSSVATALAAGIASLTLLLLRTFNEELDSDKKMAPFYEKKGIMRVFNKMGAKDGGILLPKLFPQAATTKGNIMDELAANFSLRNLTE